MDDIWMICGWVPWWVCSGLVGGVSVQTQKGRLFARMYDIHICVYGVSFPTSFLRTPHPSYLFYLFACQTLITIHQETNE